MIDEDDAMDLAGGQYDYGPQPIAAIMEQRKMPGAGFSADNSREWKARHSETAVS